MPEIQINKKNIPVSSTAKEIKDIFALLTEATEMDASDIHLSIGQKPIYRIQGDIKRQDYKEITEEQMNKMIFDTMSDVQKETFLKTKDLDFCIEIDNVARFRVNTLYNNRGPAAVFRVIPSEILPFETLNLPDVLRQIVDMEKGLVLVTGPTGSGKSTTLAAIIDLVNKSRGAHLVTVEDPVEFVHHSKKCLIQHREVGIHTKSFASALRSALREDVDIVLVGELRDIETISLALAAAETGALVFGTLHTSSAAKTVSRIIDVFPSDEQDKVRVQLGETVKVIVAQVLLKKIGGGRCAAQEILFGNRAIANMIEANQISQIANTLEISGQDGMNSMDQALIKLIKEGKITKEAALIHASSKDKILTLGEK